jgi:hypothetical protein
MHDAHFRKGREKPWYNKGNNCSRMSRFNPISTLMYDQPPQISRKPLKWPPITNRSCKTQQQGRKHSITRLRDLLRLTRNRFSRPRRNRQSTSTQRFTILEISQSQGPLNGPNLRSTNKLEVQWKEEEQRRDNRGLWRQLSLKQTTLMPQPSNKAKIGVYIRGDNIIACLLWTRAAVNQAV